MVMSAQFSNTMSMTRTLTILLTKNSVTVTATIGASYVSDSFIYQKMQPLVSCHIFPVQTVISLFLSSSHLYLTALSV